jgi:transposase
VAVDSDGRLRAAILTPGQASDTPVGPKLARKAMAKGAKTVCGDKAYDSDAMRSLLADNEVEAVIPSKANRVEPISHDEEKYRRRNLVERYFRRIKEHRRLCLRSDKLGRVFMSWAWLASIKGWLVPKAKNEIQAHTP